MRYNSICQHILKLAGEGCTFPETYEYIVNFLPDNYFKINTMKKKLIMDRTIEEANNPIENASGNEKILDTHARAVKKTSSNLLWTTMLHQRVELQEPYCRTKMIMILMVKI